MPYALASGLLFGIAIRLGDGYGGAIAWLVNIGGPWLCFAFAVGWIARRRGAAPAGASLVAAAVAKYAVQLGQGEISAASAILRVLAWSAAGAVLGALFGLLGQRARTGARAAFLPLAAVLAAEPIAFLTGALRGESAELRFHWQAGALAVFAGELVLAAAALGFAACPRAAPS